MLLTDKEQEALLDESSPVHLQKIPRNVIEELKDMLSVTTGHIAPYIVDRLRKVDEHEKKVNEHDNLLTFLRRGLGALAKTPKGSRPG